MISIQTMLLFSEDPNSDAVLFGPYDNGGNPGAYENWDFDDTTALSCRKRLQNGY